METPLAHRAFPLPERRLPTLADVRVVIAPDSFSGTLTAVAAAEAMAAGWRRVRPDHDVR